jgi:amino acid transporter
MMLGPQRALAAPAPGEPGTGARPVPGELAADRLGVAGLLSFVLSAAAPLSTVAAIPATAYAVSGDAGLAPCFLVLGGILALFAVGYLTMSRHLPHAGALYAYVGQGLGRAGGVAAAWICLVTYNLLQVAMYGGVGAIAAPLVKQYLRVGVPWWGYALLVWAGVAVLGLLRVELNARVLAGLLAAEVVVVLGYDVVFLAHPAHGFDVSLLSASELLKPGVGLVLAIAMLGFVGVESAVVFAEESRRRRRTLPLATYAAITSVAVLCGLSAWAMAVTDGADKIVSDTRVTGPELMFGLAGAQLGPWASTLGQVLVLTSLVAALVALHNITARYHFALGRERVLPARLGTTSRSGAPRAGSLVQSLIGLVTVVLVAVGGYDPLTTLFYTGGTAGVLGLLILLTACAVSVLAFFARDPRGEPAWRIAIAPGLAAIGVAAVLVLTLADFATLLGVEPSSPWRWGIPAGFVVVAGLGLLHGLGLRARRPELYAAIGTGRR